MKITAEFNSVEEVLEFTSTFGKVGIDVKPMFGQENTNFVEDKEVKPVEEIENKEIKEDKDVELTKPVQLHSPDKDDTDKKEESVKQEDPKSKEEVKVTKEMVRDIMGKAMKAGKQREVKELVAKYGASKVPDLKEEDYAAVYKEAEELI